MEHSPGTAGSTGSTDRGQAVQSRPRAARAVLAATAVGTLVAGGAALASAAPGREPGTRTDLALQAEAHGQQQQVLGGSREPGVPTVQRVQHDGVVFTVTVAPARPGPNLVRVDTVPTGAGHEHPDTGQDAGQQVTGHHTAGHHDRQQEVRVGTVEDDVAGRLVPARPRPGTDGLWAVVDLPEGSSTVLVSHGPEHRVPFAVETGAGTPGPAAGWTGADGPECLGAATAAVLAGGTPPATCPSGRLDETARAALETTVATLAERGVEEVAVEADGSPRARAAYAVVRAAAGQAGVRVVRPEDQPGDRNALLVVSGWADAARELGATSRLPLRRQPIRSDGTWLAPWLLTPGVVDATAGAVLPLDFDIRDEDAREFNQALATYLPGQAPTATAYAAWRAARGESASPLRLYAASRAAYMTAEPGHAGHETEIAWFPGGTVTPVTLSPTD